VNDLRGELDKMAQAMGDGLASGDNGNPISPKSNDTGICKPDCAKCGGSGYLRVAREIHNPQFGRLELCPEVDKWGLPGADKYGLTSDEIRNLDWYSEIQFREQAEPVVTKVMELMVKRHGWLYIGGQHGLAKTCILKACVAISLRNGREAAYVTMAQIFDDLRAGIRSDDPRDGSDARLDWWMNVPILAIDEFNKFNVTEYAQERQFMLMNQRYESALQHQTITLMASNVQPTILPSYLRDRICDGRFEVLWLRGDSYRTEMEWKKEHLGDWSKLDEEKRS
jgi:hypothetical protein